MPKPFYNKSDNNLYTVRMYDYYEHGWFDIAANLTEDAAIELWNEKTANGTKMTSYSQGDYYAIFPANTEMAFRTQDVDPDK